MEIILNNKLYIIDDGCLVIDLLNKEKYKTNMIAVWINGRQLLQAEYNNRLLASGDDVKIIRLFAGG